MTRKEFDTLVSTEYNVQADFPFGGYDEAVYRHKSNQKWFAIVLKVKKDKLIPQEEIESNDEAESAFKPFLKNAPQKSASNDEKIDIVNLKCPQEIWETVWLVPNIYPAYHMNKRHWISVPLDGSVEKDTISYLLDASYNATALKAKKRLNK